MNLPLKVHFYSFRFCPSLSSSSQYPFTRIVLYSISIPTSFPLHCWWFMLEQSGTTQLTLPLMASPARAMAKTDLSPIGPMQSPPVRLAHCVAVLH